MPGTSLPSAQAARGRPVDPRKDSQILAAATALFMQHGVQGTTMEQIAREAGVSKLTLYRRFPDKDTLFTAVLNSKCEEYLPESIFENPNLANPEETLIRVGCAMLELMTSEDATRLNRVITTESLHNPEIAKRFFDSGPQRNRTYIIEMMAAFQKSANLKIPNATEAAEMFSALIVGCDCNTRRKMNLCPPPTQSEAHAYVTRAVAFFLRAYA